MKKGFTLIELIIAIVLFGIIAYLGASILTPVMEGYVDTRTKTFLFNEAQYALARMSKELRCSIPNTVRIGDGYIQFGEFFESSYYDKMGDDNLTYYGKLGNIAKGDNVSIYNTNQDYFYDGERVYTVSDINGDNVTLNKDIQPSSVYHRIYLISTPVTFYFKNGKIYRSFDYTLSDSNYGLDRGKYFVLANYVKDLQFKYTPGNFRHSAVVSIILTVAKNSLSLEYKQEVHIRNVP